VCKIKYCHFSFLSKGDFMVPNTIKSLTKIISLSCAVGPFFAYANDVFYDEPEGGFFTFPNHAIVVPWVSQTEGRIVGNRDGYTTLGLFALPEPYTNELVPFIDLRGHHFDCGRWAANAGIGGRYFICDWQLALGANVYYDYREIRHGQFQNVGVGLELLTERLNFRVNGYIPVGNNVGRNEISINDNFDGPFQIIRNRRYASLGGVDGEIEALLFQRGCFQLWGAAGAYYFQSHRRVFGHSDNLVGGEFRLEADINQYLTLEGMVTTDRIFNTRVQGRVVLNLPLDFSWWNNCCESSCGCCWLEMMYMRRPRRYEIIPGDTHCCYLTNY